MSRKIEMDLSNLLSWITDDELAYEFPTWCVKQFKITKQDIIETVNEWKQTDSSFSEEDVDAICLTLDIKESELEELSQDGD
ncbi:MAG: hypothetical protein WC307_07050 [Candidatus Nanoarchaeia archaeon]|jgi:hypothetical protein